MSYREEHAAYRERVTGEALEFQDFVQLELHRRIGIVLGNWCTGKFQGRYGENVAGYEIKLDRKFRETRNLFIETSERATTFDPWKPAGINGKGRHYVIGDWSILFLFSFRMLRGLASRHEILVNKTNTAKGFLLGEREAREYAWEIFEVELNGARGFA